MPWKTFKWNGETGDESERRVVIKNRFKKAAIAVQFAACLFQKALRRRIKVTILYATETGNSEKFARQLTDLFNRNFNAQVFTINSIFFHLMINTSK